MKHRPIGTLEGTLYNPSFHYPVQMKDSSFWLTTHKTKSTENQMDASREQEKVVGLSRRSIVVLSICCLIAIPLSSYLAWIALTSSKIAGCGGGRLFNCEHVISSRWSLWMGIPVSLLAAVLYVGMASALWIGSSDRFSRSSREFAWLIVTILAISAGFAACWFVAVQVFVLNHLCKYCLIAHSVGLIATGVVVWNRPTSISTLRWAFVCGAIGIGILISGQVFSEPPPTYRIEKFKPAVPARAVELKSSENSGQVEPDDSLFEAPVINSVEPSRKTSGLNLSDKGLRLFATVRPEILVAAIAYAPMPQEPNSKPADSATPDKPATPAPRRTVAIIGGTVKLDVTQWPIVGSTNAKYIFVDMFDYACPHCRNTYAAIQGAEKALGGDVAMIMLPTPLNSNCNGLIQVTDPKFSESCEISKLAIAVWRCDAAAFNKFDDFMFATEQTPDFASAKAYAESLVDPAKLAAELNSDIPTQYVAKNVELYRRAGGGSVPKLMFPGTSIVGEFTSVDGLVDVIRRECK